MNDLSNVSTTIPAVVTSAGDNYNVAVGDSNLELMRDVDFGLIDGTKKPCLFKSGAERIMMAYGIEQEYELLTCIEKYEGDMPYFHYTIVCRCFKTIGDRRIHLTDGMGSANSNERMCGRASKFDVANARLKMAKKRAMVDACLNIGQLSNAFAQDIENEDFMKKGTTESFTKVLGADDPITAKQRQRIFALAGAAGFNQSATKAILAEAGFESTTKITQKDYDRVCAMFTKGANE